MRVLVEQYPGGTTHPVLRWRRRRGWWTWRATGTDILIVHLLVGGFAVCHRRVSDDSLIAGGFGTLEEAKEWVRDHGPQEKLGAQWNALCSTLAGVQLLTDRR